MTAFFKTGDRVRTLIAKHEPMIGVHVPAYVTGTFLGTESVGFGMSVALIDLDQHFSDLDEWDNVLQLDFEDGDISASIEHVDQVVLTHPIVGMLLFNSPDEALDAADDIGESYDLNDIGTLKSRCTLVHI